MLRSTAQSRGQQSVSTLLSKKKQLFCSVVLGERLLDCHRVQRQWELMCSQSRYGPTFGPSSAKEPGATKLFCIQNCHVKIPHSLSAVRCSLTSRENPWHDLHHHLFVPSALAIPWRQPPAENPIPPSISKLASSSVTASFSFSLLLCKLSGVPSFPSFLHDLLVPE